MINLLVNFAHMSRAEATDTVDRWMNTLSAQSGQISQQAKQSAEGAARDVSKVTWVAFFALLLGCACAAFGGAEAVPPSGPEGLEHRGTATPSPLPTR